MSINEPMTQDQLDAIRTRADSVTTLRRAMPGDWQRLALHLSEDTDTLIAEVERLRALTTVDDLGDEAIERMARAAFKARCETESFTWAKAGLFRESYREDARAALAALLGGEQA